MTNLWLAAGLLVVFSASAIVTMRMILRSQGVVTPRVLGLRPVEAGEAAEQAGLRLQIDGRRHDRAVPAGKICSQDPPAGTAIKTGRALRVMVSAGTQRVTIPAVAGRTLREAQILLEQAGLSRWHTVEVEDVTPENTVVMQHPPAGEAVLSEPTDIALLVSRGPTSADFVMPDLIGLPAGPAAEALQGAGLRIADVINRAYPGAAPGTVLKQTPLPGFRVGPRTPVYLEVSAES